jgi:hypothetical protein
MGQLQKIITGLDIVEYIFPFSVTRRIFYDGGVDRFPDADGNTGHRFLSFIEDDAGDLLRGGAHLQQPDQDKYH